MLNFNKFRPAILYQAQMDGSTGSTAKTQTNTQQGTTNTQQTGAPAANTQSTATTVQSPGSPAASTQPSGGTITAAKWQFRVTNSASGKVFEKSLDGTNWIACSELEYTNNAKATDNDFTPAISVDPNVGNITKVGAATANAINLAKQTYNSFDELKNNWKNISYAAQGRTGEDKISAVSGAILSNLGQTAKMAGQFGINALGMAGPSIASFIDKGAQNARDAATESFVNSGLDVIGQMGPYGAAFAGAGKLAMAFGNNYAAKVGNRFKVDETLKTDLGNAYNGMFDDLDKAANPGLKSIFHSSKVARQQARAKMNQMFAQNIRDEAQDVNDAARYEGTGIRNAIALNGGYTALRAGKKGMKINNPLDWARYTVKAQKGSVINIQESDDYRPSQEEIELDTNEILDELDNYIDKGIIRHVVNEDENIFTSENATLLQTIQQDQDFINAVNSKYSNSKFIVAPNNPYSQLNLALSDEDMLKYFPNGLPQEQLIQEDQASFMKEGGTFNVIPDGALHKNKHNMEDAEGLTKKGIPVVTEEEGKLVQQAEIEKNEIIFRLEVTKKLEELAKKGTDEAAIEAGKLLVKEILHNTEDNTGLIDEVN